MNTNKKLSTVRRLVLCAAFSALVIVLTFTNLGFLTFSPVVSITILQIPVILAATVGGLPEGIFVGFIMGLMSLIKAAMHPGTVLDPLFVNPLNSILPRMLLGLVAWGIWRLLNFIPKMPGTVAAAITGFTATFAHTLMVYGCIFIFDGARMGDALRTLNLDGMGYLGVVGLGLPSELSEALASTIVCAAVYAGLFIANNRKSKLSKVEEENQ